MSSENRYDSRNVDNMEMLYGRGFLSGGGADEVALIFDGIDLSEADVLDLGCGSRRRNRCDVDLARGAARDGV